VALEANTVTSAIRVGYGSIQMLQHMLIIAAMDRELAGLIARLGAQPAAAMPGGHPFWTARVGARSTRPAHAPQR
jgi:hypothetical protein